MNTILLERDENGIMLESITAEGEQINLFRCTAMKEWQRGVI